MPINYYEPKFLRGAIEQITPARMFFRNKFFTQKITFPTKTVTFEFAQNSRNLLPFVSDHSPSAPITRNSYQAKTFTPALISGSRVINPDTIYQKLFAEAPYNSGVSPDQRAREIAARDLIDLTEALYRQEEYMCARIKQDGKLLIDGEGIKAEIDYGFTNIENTSSANKWTANFDLLGKLLKSARELRKNGINPDTLILGHEASEALMNNEGVLKLRHDSFVNIPAPDSLEDGITFITQLRAPGVYLNVYEYDEYYTDNTGNLVPLIDPKTAILQSSREQNYMLYGAVTYIDPKTKEYVSSMNEYVPYRVVNEDPPVQKLIVASRPLPMPQDINSWLVLKNVI